MLSGGGCNPLYVLRNRLAHIAIRRAPEQDAQEDDSEIDRPLQLLQAPFDAIEGAQEYAAPPPDWGRQLQISCSS